MDLIDLKRKQKNRMQIMKTLVKKMDNLGLLRVVLIYYAVIYIALALVMPVTIVILGPTLFLNPTIIV